MLEPTTLSTVLHPLTSWDTLTTDGICDASLRTLTKYSNAFCGSLSKLMLVPQYFGRENAPCIVNG